MQGTNISDLRFPWENVIEWQTVAHHQLRQPRNLDDLPPRADAANILRLQNGATALAAIDSGTLDRTTADILTTGGGNRFHPTEKAVDILTPLIRAYSKKGDTVLDPFSGSGSTSVAAALMGRNSIGIELEEGYCTYARNRLAGVSRYRDRKAAA